nr:hypothetical protein [uncultured Cellulosilyticum sp.]
MDKLKLYFSCSLPAVEVAIKIKFQFIHTLLAKRMAAKAYLCKDYSGLDGRG